MGTAFVGAAVVEAVVAPVVEAAVAAEVVVTAVVKTVDVAAVPDTVKFVTTSIGLRGCVVCSLAASGIMPDTASAAVSDRTDSPACRLYAGAVTFITSCPLPEREHAVKAEQNIRRIEIMRIKFFMFSEVFTAACCLLPVACCLIPTAYCLIPTAYCLIPTAYCLIPTAYLPNPYLTFILSSRSIAFFPIRPVMIPVVTPNIALKGTPAANTAMIAFRFGSVT